MRSKFTSVFLEDPTTVFPLRFFSGISQALVVEFSWFMANMRDKLRYFHTSQLLQVWQYLINPGQQSRYEVFMKRNFRERVSQSALCHLYIWKVVKLKSSVTDMAGSSTLVPPPLGKPKTPSNQPIQCIISRRFLLHWSSQRIEYIFAQTLPMAIEPSLPRRKIETKLAFWGRHWDQETQGARWILARSAYTHIA